MKTWRRSYGFCGAISGAAKDAATISISTSAEIHAAGVRLGDEAALIVGPSGAGKSTLALAAAIAGHTLLGDDFLLLTVNRAHPVYRRTKAHDASLAMLGDDLANLGSVINAGVVDQKRIIETNLADMESTGCKVGAIFVPRVGRSTGVTNLHPSTVARRTVGPSMQGLLGGSDATLRRIARLVSSVPTYEISVGPNLVENVKVLEQAMGVTSDRTPVS
jgi:energy-coupling factor transporter ATP-binding protein EcfA2